MEPVFIRLVGIESADDELQERVGREHVNAASLCRVNNWRLNVLLVTFFKKRLSCCLENYRQCQESRPWAPRGQRKREAVA